MEEENKEENVVTLKLVIDNREREIKDYFKDKENVSFKNLDIGDICFMNGEDIILIIERKTINDLSASIIDSRSREQKARLLASSGISKDRIMYLIEGDIIKTQTTIKGGYNTLVGSLINIQLRDGLKVYKTASINETIKYIEKLFEKLKKDGDSFWKYENNNEISDSQYCSTLKTKKKDNMTHKIWFHKQLTLIPQVSSVIADTIIKHYPSVEQLVLAYSSLEDKKDCVKMLECLTFNTSTGKTRKLGPKISEKVFEYLCPEL
jgi:ERCC4-type nuclease